MRSSGSLRGVRWQLSARGRDLLTPCYRFRALVSTAESPSRVNSGKVQNEHMLSGLPPIATDARTSSIGSFVPLPAIATRREVLSCMRIEQ